MQKLRSTGDPHLFVNVPSDVAAVSVARRNQTVESISGYSNHASTAQGMQSNAIN
jgi:hypothetical protein